ncbi:MAG: 3-oxoacyl-[acyl-carrier protein] reductase [Chloroflexi bacterium]|jgi:NAD(P)-dependent dehydrogenase (short-subunit alcohol dehydrogenase family)|nr:MAG: 3-oxoacyl-[acyl-carrier protein] reductase [Chloroflexota bacterium]
MYGLDGRIAVITGGAGGLGRAASIRLAAEKCEVAVLDIKDPAAVCAEIREAGGIAESWVCDTTNEAQLAEVFGAIEQRFGRVDILVNNAGILSPRKPWNEWKKEELERYAEVNYVGYFLTTKAAYPLLKKSATPRVINIASRTFFMGNPGQLPYVASKGAVQGLTWNLARELGEEGINVNAVMPGMVATPGTTEHSGEEAFNRVMGNQAIKKRVEPEHLAGAIAFMASDDAAMITGQSLIVDGGGYLH